MSFDDMFKPYSPEIRGDLLKYLTSHDGLTTDNHFFGPKYFEIIRKRGLMIPGVTFVSVDNSPAPDIGYFVNSEGLLESRGVGEMNMSMIGAKKGVYNPKKVLKNRHWSISPLNLEQIC